VENAVTPLERKVVYLKLEDILPNRFQPRIKFDEQALNELSQSIKEHGVLSPITVRPLGNKYEIIAGERRFKASTLAGLTEIPALVVTIDDKESAEVALIENVQRKDLTPIEEAISYKKIFDMNIGISQDSLAKKLGKSQSAIANKLRLLNLSDEVQEALLENKISERHARSLLKIKDTKIQNQLLEKIINERLTVRKTDEEIINMLNNNKDIEILDFELENEPLKKEYINNPLNRFEGLYNLPKSEIIEDKEDEFIPNIPDVLVGVKQNNEQQTQKINDSLEGTISIPLDEFNKIQMENKKDAQTENNVNPGFLDISKIEKTANDINASGPKLSLEELLKMPVEPQKKNNLESLNEVTSIPPATSKFFTMVEDENDKPSFEPQTDNNNLFDENAESNTKELEDKYNLNFDSKFIPQEKTIFDDINKLDEKLNEPSIENESFGFNNDIFNNVLNPNDVMDNQEFKIPENNIISEQKETTLLNQNTLQEEIDTIPNFNVDLFKNLDTEMTLEKELPLNDIIDEEENIDEEPEFSFNQLNEFKPVPPVGYSPIYDLDEEEEVVEKHVDNSKYGAADLKTIINTIRKCAETIEKYGYVIDTEEFDFEDMYQVIFKVQKKQ